MKLFYTSLLCLLLSQAIFSQAPGSLDLSFNTIGYNSFGTTSATFDNAQDIVTLPNGKMVFCGTTGVTGNLEMCVGRMNEDGSFNDINYTDLSRTASFPHGRHTNDLAYIAKAYKNNSSKY